MERKLIKNNWKEEQFGENYVRLDNYILDHQEKLGEAQIWLREETIKLPDAIMIGEARELQLLSALCYSMRARKTLDIGAFTGYSALSIALVLPDDGELHSFDVNATHIENLGRKAWRMAGVEHKIKFHLGSAVENLEKLIADGQSGTFDFAFIDADKTGYKAYYELCLKLLRTGGMIAIDNALWSGKVTMPDVNDADTVALRELNAIIAKDDRVMGSLLTIGDGTYLAIKK